MVIEFSLGLYGRAEGRDIREEGDSAMFWGFMQGGVKKKLRDIALDFLLSPLKTNRPTDT